MEFKEQVKKSFASCREDIKSLQQNDESINSRLAALEQENANLKAQLNDMKSLLEEIKSSISQTQQDTTPSQSPQHPTSQPQTPPTQAQNPTPQTTQTPVSNKDPYEALLAFKAKVNKKDALKQKMVSMIGEGGMNLSELKFMIVEHFGYCSKATFYNYLKELELERYVRIERHHSKNIIHIEGMSKEI